MAPLRVFLSVFPRWYFLEVPQTIIRRYWTCARVVSSAFPFFFLLRTLFSPWKSICGAYPTAFNFSQFFQAWTLNLVSRGVGFTVRAGTLGVGLICEGALIIGFAAALLVWILYPILIVILLR